LVGLVSKQYMTKIKHKYCNMDGQSVSTQRPVNNLQLSALQQ
jgi:hypothetical protein